MQFSVEFSPPKEALGLTQRQDVILRYIDAIHPNFISLTCGAGGTESRKDLACKIIDHVRKQSETPVVAHIPHSGRSRIETMGLVREFHEAGANMVLALRGDPAPNTTYTPHPDGFEHTADFISAIKQSYPDIPVYVAGYPEKHPDALTEEEDITHLKRKIAAGASMVLEQFCLDNRIAPAWHQRCVADFGITVPLVPVVISMQYPKRVFAMAANCAVSIPEQVQSEFTALQGESNVDRAQRASLFMEAQICALRDSGEDYIHVCALNSPVFLEMLAGYVIDQATSTSLLSADLR